MTEAAYQASLIKRYEAQGWTVIKLVQASREGVNLSSAEHLVFVGIDFAALSYLQGRDRASYLGRTTPPQIHWIFAHGGIEPRIYQTVKQKEDFTVAHFNRIKHVLH